MENLEIADFVMISSYIFKVIVILDKSMNTRSSYTHYRLPIFQISSSPGIFSESKSSQSILKCGENLRWCKYADFKALTAIFRTMSRSNNVDMTLNIICSLIYNKNGRWYAVISYK